MKNFCFTVDDNVRVFQELSEGTYASMFEHPYLAVYKRLHEAYGLRVQLNLFYEGKDFDLSQMTARYRGEFLANADWLKLSFHSRQENVSPYEMSSYGEVFSDCERVHQEILRFASEASLAKTTTVHYCQATEEGLRALKDNGVLGLLGLYGSEGKPRSSYQNTPEEAARLRRGEVVCRDGVAYAAIDVILNCFGKEEILRQLEGLAERDLVKAMIHEQYFYPDYKNYQSDFEEKLAASFAFLTARGFESTFFEDMLG